jgi:hypothetical protein
MHLPPIGAAALPSGARILPEDGQIGARTATASIVEESSRPLCLEISELMATHVPEYARWVYLTAPRLLGSSRGALQRNNVDAIAYGI